jgi:hypothetical protein
VAVSAWGRPEVTQEGAQERREADPRARSGELWTADRGRQGHLARGLNLSSSRRCQQLPGRGRMRGPLRVGLPAGDRQHLQCPVQRQHSSEHRLVRALRPGQWQRSLCTIRITPGIAVPPPRFVKCRSPATVPASVALPRPRGSPDLRRKGCRHLLPDLSTLPCTCLTSPSALVSSRKGWGLGTQVW